MKHRFCLILTLLLGTGWVVMADPSPQAVLQKVQMFSQGSRLDALMAARDKMMQEARSMDVQLNELKPVTEGRGAPDDVAAARVKYDALKRTQDDNQKKLNQIMAMIAEERKKLFNER